MAFERPTLAELIDRAQSDIEVFMPGTDARLRRSVVGILARAHAGAVHGLYGRLEYIARQIIEDTADSDYLDRRGAILGVARTPAVQATGAITFTGANGTTIPAGSTLQRADGAEFTTDADVTIAAGVADADATAVEAGEAGNCDAGATVTLESPIPGVNSDAVSAAGISGGADLETDDAYRARVIERIQQPPSGGAASDYVQWALQVAGVTRAWCFPEELGAGTVIVRFVRDNDASIIPDGGEVASVQAYIDALRPVTAHVTVEAPIADATAFTFTALAPNTTAVKAAITAALTDLLARESQPGGVLHLSHIRAAVSNAIGTDDFAMSAPAGDVVSATGHMPTLGVVTFP